MEPSLPASTQEMLDSLVTVGYLKKLFRRGDLTILSWRQKHGLPHIRIKGDARSAIRYNLTEVLAWARANRKRVFPVNESDTS